jgi:hypothetical protein
LKLIDGGAGVVRGRLRSRWPVELLEDYWFDPHLVPDGRCVHGKLS